MGKKKITLTLSERGIDDAIKELREYQKELTRKTEILRQKIAERIASEAQQGFSGAIVDDILPSYGSSHNADVSVTIDNRDKVTVVIASGEDAVWVEFGAGVYHNGTAGSSPHPNGAELGLTIGSYGQGYGKRSVWGYYDDSNTLVLTHGTPARMPMARAVNEVLNDIKSIADEVFT